MRLPYIGMVYRVTVISNQMGTTLPIEKGTI
ncbi:hypothetical protein PEDI_48360 [Persicobacter diffluens]|uniref:Uncharacterized protein n=1 Tax=Persicobacter diffluens TaxID=981 RepID=A0AAN5AMC7_9BACT|nr:hypothetical protein PEDI_48360 [Persicobacter diffluens]